MCILYYPTAKLKHVNKLVTVRPVSDTDPEVKLAESTHHCDAISFYLL